MTPYLIALLIIGATAIFARPMSEEGRIKTSIVTALLMTPLLVLLVFRDHRLGIDVPAYLAGYEIAPNVDVTSGESVFNFEPGFTIYTQVLNALGVSPAAFIGITAILTLVPVAVVIARFSDIPALSVYIFATYGLYVFSYSGLRQSLAISLCFLSIYAIRNGKLFHFLLIVLVASQFHLSALAFLPAYWIFRVNLRGAQVFIGSALIVTVFALQAVIYPVLYSFYRDSDVRLEQTDAFTFFVVLILIWAGSFFLSPPNKTTDDLTSGTRNLLLAAILFQALAGVSFVVGRTGFYYLAFLILLLPRLVRQQPDPAVRFVLTSIIVTAGAILFLIQASAYGLFPYAMH